MTNLFKRYPHLSLLLYFVGLVATGSSLTCLFFAEFYIRILEAAELGRLAFQATVMEGTVLFSIVCWAATKLYTLCTRAVTLYLFNADDLEQFFGG